MTTYLTIITTSLVLTQIIRLVQNAIQLKRQGEIAKQNNYILKVFMKLEYWLDGQDELDDQEGEQDADD